LGCIFDKKIQPYVQLSVVFHTVPYPLFQRRATEGKNAIRSQPPNFSARAYYSGCISGIMYKYREAPSHVPFFFLGGSFGNLVVPGTGTLPF
jgi:hypothetical protein